MDSILSLFVVLSLFFSSRSNSLYLVTHSYSYIFYIIFPREAPLLAFIRPKTTFIGLDIQPDEIRMLQLRHGKQRIIIENFIINELPVDTIIDGKIKQPESLCAAIIEIVQKCKIKGYPTAIALPAQCVISKRIQLPTFLNELEREVEIKTNLAHYFPGIADELCFDFLTMHNAQDVLLIASRAEQLNSYVNVINRAGLAVKIVDVDFYALARAAKVCVPEASAHEIIAILEVGLHKAQFVAIKNQEVIFQQQLNLSIADDLQRVLALFYSMYGKASIYKMLLSGLLSKKAIFLVDKITIVAEKFAIKIEHAKPLKSLPPNALMSFGLALRGVSGC